MELKSWVGAHAINEAETDSLSVSFRNYEELPNRRAQDVPPNLSIWRESLKFAEALHCLPTRKLNLALKRRTSEARTPASSGPEPMPKTSIVSLHKYLEITVAGSKES
jgi:hypothetical protein